MHFVTPIKDLDLIPPEKLTYYGVHKEKMSTIFDAVIEFAKSDKYHVNGIKENGQGITAFSDKAVYFDIHTFVQRFCKDNFSRPEISPIAIGHEFFSLLQVKNPILVYNIPCTFLQAELFILKQYEKQAIINYLIKTKQVWDNEFKTK